MYKFRQPLVRRSVPNLPTVLNALAAFLCLALLTSCTSALAPGGPETRPVGQIEMAEAQAGEGENRTVQGESDPLIYFQTVLTARRYAQQDQCDAAIQILEDATTFFPDDGDIWALTGICLVQTEQWLRSIEAFEKALQLGVSPWDPDVSLNPNDIMIEIAKSYAQAGDREGALVWLEKGLQHRYDERPSIASETGFSSLAEDKEFRGLAGLAPDGKFTRNEQWRYDIAFLGKQIELLHVQLNNRPPMTRVRSALSGLSESVPDLSDEQIVSRLDLIVGALKTGHDRMRPDLSVRGALHPLALKLYHFSDGLFVIDADQPELVEAKIESFDPVPAQMALERVMTAFPGDNEMGARWTAVRHLTQPSTLEALGIIEDAERMTSTVTDASGRKETVRPRTREAGFPGPALASEQLETPPLYLSRTSQNYWLQSLGELNAVYVQLNRIADSNDETLAEFSARIGMEARKPDVRNLILDLRHSPGGNSYLTGPLLRQLIGFSAASEENQLYVIIGRNTFSASQNIVTDLDRLARPILVGEPSGSRPNAMAEAGRFRLPFSGLSGSLSSQYHQHSFPEDQRVWVAPDHPVAMTSRDYFEGRDPALENIARMIRSGAALETGPTDGELH